MDVREVALKAQYYALSHGILVQETLMTEAENSSQPRPSFPRFALFPSPLPRHELAFLKSIQPQISELYDNVSRDHDFLKTALKRVAETDEFTRRLVDVLETVDREGVSNETSFSLLRSDYMLESRPEAWNSLTKMKQTEVNTIAASNGCLSERFPELHRYTVSLRDGIREDNYEKELPTPPNGRGIAEGLAAAWKQYGSNSAVIVMLVGNRELNVYDTYQLGAELWLNHGVKMVRVVFDDVILGGSREAKLREDKALVIDGQEVAVTYFRTGYTPEHYPSEKHWDVRSLFERSRSIQCPSVALHLTGTKKVQQELGKPGVLEKFLRSADAVERVRATFLNMYSLDQTPKGDEAAAKGIAEPMNYVLKPQREGGGSNMYFDEVRKKLIELQDSDERSAYTMQERIFPLVTTNYLVCSGKLDDMKPEGVVNEMGIYGAFVRTHDEVILNSVPGYYMRAKPVDMGEGGLLMGYAACASPWLHQ